MPSVFALVHDYQTLRAMERLLVQLDPADEARLSGLALLLEGEDRGSHESDPNQRVLPRFIMNAAAQLDVGGSLVPVRLRNLSGGGATLSSAPALPLGRDVLLHLHDAIDGFDYVFPGRVAWVRPEQLGLGFDRVPTRVIARDRTKVAVPYGLS